jgi:hypothetical protein
MAEASSLNSSLIEELTDCLETDLQLSEYKVMTFKTAPKFFYQHYIIMKIMKSHHCVAFYFFEPHALTSEFFLYICLETDRFKSQRVDHINLYCLNNHEKAIDLNKDYEVLKI